MKLKIKINGPKVHDVGYRVFLMTEALNCNIHRVYACLRGKGTLQQTVICLVEGKDANVVIFLQKIKIKKPEKAEVSSVTFKDYDGDVMLIHEFAQIAMCFTLHKLFEHSRE
jgi:acylphosphatase